MNIDNELIDKWEPKIQRMLSNTFVLGMDRDDIAQELRIVLIKAAKAYTERKDVIFHTYLHTAMVNTIRTLISKAQKRIEISSPSEEAMMNRDGTSIPLSDRIEDEENNYEKIELQMWLDSRDILTDKGRFIKGMNMTPKEHLFIQLRLEGLTMEEITEDLDESAYKVRQGVREKLQEVMHYEQTETEQGRLYSE